MKRKKKVWIFAGFTIFLFFLASIIFPLSVYFGDKTDPDKYESIGWIAALGILMLSAIFGCITSLKWENLSESND